MAKLPHRLAIKFVFKIRIDWLVIGHISKRKACWQIYFFMTLFLSSSVDNVPIWKNENWSGLLYFTSVCLVKIIRPPLNALAWCFGSTLHVLCWTCNDIFFKLRYQHLTLHYKNIILWNKHSAIGKQSQGYRQSCYVIKVL